MKNIIIILGTRPEAIKLAPVILELRKNKNYKIFVCNTEQQKELSNQTLNFFGITPDFKLDSMIPNQTLAEIQSRILERLSAIYAHNKFDATIVQGDTITAFSGSLTSFYNHIPLFYVESGLRNHNLAAPFPEEGLRQMISRIADLHFAPTKIDYDALLKDNISEHKITITGNTVIDALSFLSDETIKNAGVLLEKQGIQFNDKLVLITTHRRENHGHRLDIILQAVADLTKKFCDHQFILPVHPNPNVCDKVYSVLKNIPNLILTSPFSYPELVCIMKDSKLVLTDSGGIQEEASTFGMPVLVMRNETDRNECVNNGHAKLVGADYDKIVFEASEILAQDKSNTRLTKIKNAYGDGNASQKIANSITNFWK